MDHNFGTLFWGDLEGPGSVDSNPIGHAILDFLCQQFFGKQGEIEGIIGAKVFLAPGKMVGIDVTYENTGIDLQGIPNEGGLVLD